MGAVGKNQPAATELAVTEGHQPGCHCRPCWTQRPRITTDSGVKIKELLDYKGYAIARTKRKRVK